MTDKIPEKIRTWFVQYPEAMPKTSAYYMTFYYNNELQDYRKKKWCPWRSDMTVNVFYWVPDSGHKYYCPCVEWSEKNISW
jgi:hypothetical protein